MQPHKYPLLFSYAYFRRERNENKVHEILSNPKVEWLIDSGGFSALNKGEVISLDEYCQWLNKWKQYLHGYVMLDIVGDPKGTDRNLQIMLDRGLRPLPVHVWGDDEKRMDQLFEYNDWVACGGLRRPHRGHAPKEYVKQKMLWAKGRKVHWLGYTTHEMVTAMKPYSVDSASLAAGFMYGSITMYRNGSCKLHTRTTASARKPSSWTLKEKIALSQASVASSDLVRLKEYAHRNDNVPGIATVNAFLRYARDIQRVYGTRYYQAVHGSVLQTTFLEIDKIEQRESA